MAEIALEHITKRYGDGYEAVKDLNLDVADGEFMILVGPSGCGKSTALRMVAGLGGHHRRRAEDRRPGRQRQDPEGPGHRDGVPELRAVPAHDRARQHGLRAQARRACRRPRSTQKVDEAARILDLEQHLERKPANLSGGQRQRVAMGRAIVRNPSAFLMDEPLSNLDAKLRVQMRAEISRIQQRFETTTLYVTHDQTEALTLGDRIAVMRAGKLQQVGAPMELYDRPNNLFVAGFIGSPAMNFLPAHIDGDVVKLPFGDVHIPDALRARLEKGPGGGRDGVIAGLRPDDFEDAALVQEHGTGHDVHGPRSTCWSRWARSSTRTSRSRPSRSPPQELQELAEEAGTTDLPDKEGTPGGRAARVRQQGAPGSGDRALVQLRAPAPVRP